MKKEKINDKYNSPLYLVVGRSGSGKNHLLSVFGITSIPSFTTRPMRPGETDGVEHQFVDRVVYALAKDTPGAIVTSTEFHGNVYWSSLEDVNNTKYQAYIIDPKGIYNLFKVMDKGAIKRPLVIVAVFASPFRRLKRMLQRGDGLIQAISRIINDRKEFKDFEEVVKNSTIKYKIIYT